MWVIFMLRTIWAAVRLLFVVIMGMNKTEALKLKAYTEKLQTDVEKYEIEQVRARLIKAVNKAGRL